MDYKEKPGIDLNEFKAKKKITYEMFLNAEKIAGLYQIAALPTIYVINKSGKIIYAGLGYNEKECSELLIIVENAVKE